MGPIGPVRGHRGRLVAPVLVALVLAGCAQPSSRDGRVRVVAAFYPLAWAAKQIGDPGADVLDLTPRGAEPHDLSLTARQRSAVDQASLVLLLGAGFQPELARAVGDTRGKVVDVLATLPLLPSTEKGLSADPHVWLDPVLMEKIVSLVEQGFVDVDAAGRQRYAERADALQRALRALSDAYASGLSACSLRTLVTTHRAFGYLAKEYGLNQVGLTGLTPEAEPAASSLQRVREAARRGEVGAIFYESTDEGRRIGESVARDLGVPAFPLSTLESDPAPNDYAGQMRDNLGQLRRGLRCR